MKILYRIKHVFHIFLVTAILVSGTLLAMSDQTVDVPLQDEVAPLKGLLAVVEKDYQGRVLEVEMEKEVVDGEIIWVYEVKLLTRKGKVYELEYDAVTLKLLKTEN